MLSADSNQTLGAYPDTPCRPQTDRPMLAPESYVRITMHTSNVFVTVTVGNATDLSHYASPVSFD